MLFNNNQNNIKKLNYMKKLFTGFAILGTIVFASAQTINLDRTIVDYGTVKTGSNGERIVKVTNTGDKPLILSNVKAGCGCTTPVWSKDPILPGKSSEIKIGYNTSSNGGFTKQVEVMSNDPENGRVVVTIKGTVDPNAPEVAVVKAEPKAAVAAPKHKAKKMHKTAKNRKVAAK